MTAMTMGMGAMEIDEIESLLPWHAAGTLKPRDARLVEDALARDPRLAREYALIQDEIAETIHVNESLGAPSADTMHKLFAAIDAEPVRPYRRSSNVIARLAGFLISLSPRTLAYSAAVGAFALLLQAGVLTAIVTQHSSGYQVASAGPSSTGGARVLVRFQPDAKLTDIAQLLDRYRASIVEGPKADMFQIRLSGTVASKDADAAIKQLRTEKIVGFAELAQ